jgi:hypothetical protein
MEGPRYIEQSMLTNCDPGALKGMLISISRGYGLVVQAAAIPLMVNTLPKKEGDGTGKAPQDRT